MKYLLFITKPYSISILEPIYTYIHNMIGGEVKWYIVGKEKDIDVHWDQLHSTKEVIEFSPEAIIVPGNVVPHFWPGLKVQVFHGLGEEKRGHYRITGFFDLYCTPGPYMTKHFIQLAKIKKSFLVKETGWPKLDPLVKKVGRDQMKQKLGLNPQKPLILYAPTFSPKYTSASALFDTIAELRDESWQWMIKFHSLMDPSLMEQYKKLTNQSFVISESENVLPLMQAADILLTDTSSVAYEYLLLNRPIITYRAKVRKDKGIDIQAATELKSVIERSLNKPGEFSHNRRKYLKELHPYIDGKSSKRVLEAIENVLYHGLYLQLKRKRLNLVRKWQIRRLVQKWER